MVKNDKGGNKTKSKARKNQQYEVKVKYEDCIKSDEQEYAKIIKVNGGGRYELDCFDGIKRLGIARGNIKRNGKVSLGQIVLVSKRDYQDTKCDLLHFYSIEEVRCLVENGDISSSFSDGMEQSSTEDILFSTKEEVEEDWNSL